MRAVLALVLVLGLGWVSMPLLMTAETPGLAEPVVSNVRAAQRARTILVEIRYDLEYRGEDKVFVSVALSEDGGATYTPLSEGLSGDWGNGVVPGDGRQVVWKPYASWLGRTVTNVVFQVSTKIWAPPGMVWIGPGTFTMGSQAGEVGRYSDESPQTEVRIGRGYWLGRYEVTQGEWESLMGINPSRFKGADRPVESVSWAEAMEYCRRLTARERGAGLLGEGWEYRLPTEAQWEYACRAGGKPRYSFGDRETDLGRYAWYDANSGGWAQPVGQKEPNRWGLYDMHGNVWEWCLDWYRDRLSGRSVTDPTGPASGSHRVVRGGGWISVARLCRSANRDRFNPSFRRHYLGFRLALVQVRGVKRVVAVLDHAAGRCGKTESCE